MRAALTRAPLERAVQVGLAATVLVLATASSIVGEIQQPARTWRWLFLLGLCVLALALAYRRRRELRVPPLPFAILALLAALAIVSAAWSPYPRLTIERGVTFAVGLTAAAAIGAVASADRRFARGVLAALVAAATTVALLGFAVLAYDSELAVQGSTADDPARFQGFGMNPNTASLLYAVTLPAAVWLAATAATRMRVVWGLSTLAILLSLFASGSRGATAASFLGVLLAGLALRRSWRGRAAIAVAVAGVWAVGVVASDMRSLQPEFIAAIEQRGEPPRVDQGPTGTATPQPPPNGTDIRPPNYPVPQGQQKGPFPFVQDHVVYDVYSHGFQRGESVFQPAQTGLFKGGGRLAVWEGAFTQAWRRPLLGYGFGLEEQVFVDRYYAFEGSRPENSYLGWMLQLGLIGTVLFLAAGVAVAVRLLRGPRSPESVVAAAGALAGFAVAALQSFPYSMGSIAAFAFWVLLAVAAAPAQAEAEPAVDEVRVSRPRPAPREVVAS